MVYRIADNIISPLGETTAENYAAVEGERTLLRRYEQYRGIPDPFVASFLSDEQWQRLRVEGMTRFESLAFRSARQAMDEAGIDGASAEVVFILSTTKANIELLQSTGGLTPGAAENRGEQSPSVAARHIATALGIQREPVTVCNACISGVSAIILAMRLLECHYCDYAVVCGADVLTPFTISGFQSLKALSAEPCRPFDMGRLGLNLGEAAATIVLGGDRAPAGKTAGHIGGEEGLRRQNRRTRWCFQSGAIRNDAFHISSPSKDGEGARLALVSAYEQWLDRRGTVGHGGETVGHGGVEEELAFVNAHGTATLFNDQMESVAIERAGLSNLPVNALKGYFGHTLGAAGVLETILSMASVDHHRVLGTKGFEERGVSGNLVLSDSHSETSGRGFVKMISGFGGCNAAIVVTKSAWQESQAEGELSRRKTTGNGDTLRQAQGKHSIRLTPRQVSVDGREIFCEGRGASMLTDLYKRHIDDYPKYYKMDGLCRLGFVASTLLLKAEGNGGGKRAIILFNHSSSIQSDLSYLSSIQDPANYFPSPSAFVYTLPNIVTGEIAIRNHYQGETSFYILPQKDRQLMEQVITASFADPETQSMLCGWIDYEDDEHFEAELEVREK